VIRLVVLASLVLPLVAAAEGAAAPRKQRVAVLEIRPLGTEASKAELLSEIALTEAASMPAFDVIGKSDINSLIGFEKSKQVAGCTEDSACLAEVGGALGVDYILVGSLGKIGSLYRLDLRLVDVKKARVRSRTGVTVEGVEDKLVAAIQKSVRDLLAPQTGPPDLARAAPARPAPAKEVTAPDLSPRPTAAGSASTPAGQVTASAPGRDTTWAWVTGGAGAALLAGGAVAGLSAKSAFDDEKKAAATGNLAAYDSAKSKVKSMSTVADVLFVGGAVGLGVSAYLFLWGGAPAAVALDVAPTPGGAQLALAGRF
jgi:TolB-like protein